MSLKKKWAIFINFLIFKSENTGFDRLWDLDLFKNTTFGPWISTVWWSQKLYRSILDSAQSILAIRTGISIRDNFEKFSDRPKVGQNPKKEDDLATI